MSTPRIGVNVKMGQLAVAREGQLCTLLGSCVGILLYNKRKKIGGLAHAVLPAASGETRTPGKYVDTAIAELVARVADGASKIGLIAKIAGDADMFRAGSEATIGSQNLHAAEHELATAGIPIVGRHCGGRRGRRMTIDVATGTVIIQQVGLPESIEI